MTVTDNTNCTIEEMAERMREADNFVICGHVSPDGDCIGSQLALLHSLKALGKHAVATLAKDEAIPIDLSFMPGIDQMVFAGAYEGPCDTFVAVDSPNPKRIGDAQSLLLDRCSQSFTIDHHACKTTMSDFNYIDPDSASTSMLVWKLACTLVGQPPFETAICAYTGLVTDTGGFRFQNTDADAFEFAAKMIDLGVEPEWVANNVFMQRSMASLKLEALAIERMQLFAEGKAVMSWITAQDMADQNAVKADVDPLIDALRCTRGVRVACMLREQDGVVRGSLRAKDDVDVSQVAVKFGGGGHKAAAGFTIEAPMDQAWNKVRDELIKVLDSSTDKE